MTKLRNRIQPFYQIIKYDNDFRYRSFQGFHRIIGSRLRKVNERPLLILPDHPGRPLAYKRVPRPVPDVHALGEHHLEDLVVQKARFDHTPIEHLVHEYYRRLENANGFELMHEHTWDGLSVYTIRVYTLPELDSVKAVPRPFP